MARAGRLQQHRNWERASSAARALSGMPDTVDTDRHGRYSATDGILFCLQVSKVKVQECSVYKTCWDCLGAKDPYCGWCSLENK
jgi:hypothetical protein